MQSRSTSVLPEAGNTCEVCGGLGGGGGEMVGLTGGMPSCGGGIWVWSIVSGLG